MTLSLAGPAPTFIEVTSVREISKEISGFRECWELKEKTSEEACSTDSSMRGYVGEMSLEPRSE